MIKETYNRIRSRYKAWRHDRYTKNKEKQLVRLHFKKEDLRQKQRPSIKKIIGISGLVLIAGVLPYFIGAVALLDKFGGYAWLVSAGLIFLSVGLAAVIGVFVWWAIDDRNGGMNVAKGKED